MTIELALYLCSVAYHFAVLYLLYRIGNKIADLVRVVKEVDDEEI